MGRTLLGNVIADWRAYDLDDSIYIPTGAVPSLETIVSVLSFDPARKRVFEGQQYLLGIEQVRDVVTGLERQIGRVATSHERLRAVAHYAAHDAFIDPRDAIG